MQPTRITNPLTNTLTVWHALFLREALDRFFGSRAGWAWLILEPVAHAALFATYFSFFRGNQGGVDMAMWLIVGLLTFFLFRRTSVQAMHAVDCNRAFYMFRQVHPMDAVLSRAAVEAFAMFFVATICALGAGAIGKDIIPHDPLLVLAAAAGMWLLGVGYGLISSVCMRLVPDSAHILTIIMMPMYIISGVILPLASLLPPKYLAYVLYVPLAHGVELARMGFFKYYHHMDVSLAYLYLWGIGLVAVGMALFNILEARLLRK